MQLTISEISHILRAESNWPRFQPFSTDLLGRARSLNWVSNEFGSDDGRDAHWYHPMTGDLDGVVCVAIRTKSADAIAKFHNDFSRLIETGLPNHVYMASTVAVQESDASTFRKWCRKQTAQRPRVQIFGLTELA